MEFESPAQAIAAVATLIIHADQIGTLAERDYLFTHVKEHPLFATYDETTFSDLLATTAKQIYQNFPTANEALTPAAINQLIAAINDALPPDLTPTALTIAVNLAQADGLVPAEQTILTQLALGLHLDPQTTHTILNPS
ncbi:MAG TPA: tellurite resistance TerB family protein [Anaerolineae bacterium]|nr:tellurite resistance TerB family protein [Anaerolineae bacterium]